MSAPSTNSRRPRHSFSKVVPLKRQCPSPPAPPELYRANRLLEPEPRGPPKNGLARLVPESQGCVQSAVFKPATERHQGHTKPFPSLDSGDELRTYNQIESKQHNQSPFVRGKSAPPIHSLLGCASAVFCIARLPPFLGLPVTYITTPILLASSPAEARACIIYPSSLAPRKSQKLHPPKAAVCYLPKTPLARDSLPTLPVLIATTRALV
ncbi:hypothetical protein ACQKWADRAFT_138080 [Trichoderma austrokoningii]